MAFELIQFGCIVVTALCKKKCKTDGKAMVESCISVVIK